MMSMCGLEGNVDGSQCFDLLVKYSKSEPVYFLLLFLAFFLFRVFSSPFQKKKKKLKNQETVSFWCLWNFVNVVYWQLRDLQYNNSPLNNACSPNEVINLQVFIFFIYSLQNQYLMIINI